MRKLPTLMDIIQTQPTIYFSNPNLREFLIDLQGEYKNLVEIFNLLGLFMPYPFTKNIKTAEESFAGSSKNKSSTNSG